MKKIGKALITLSVVAVGVVAVQAPASAAASGTVDCGWLPVVGVWIEKVSGSGSSGWAWTPNDGSYNQPYYRANINSSATYNVHVGCGGTPQNWQYATTSVSPQSGNADWVCVPGYASGAWNRCWPS
jgi:hypothetical protein